MPRSRPSVAFLVAVAALALALAGCSGGGLSAAQKANTAIGASQAGTATAAADAEPLPTVTDIEGVIRKGFEGLDIPYGATSVATFSDVEALVGVLRDCASDNAGSLPRTDAGFWPAVLGHCYTVGDGTKWLYGYTGRRDFAYANQMMMRFMRAKLDEADRAGAGLGDRYWQMVISKIYTLTSAGTPIAATPPAP